MRFTVYGMFGGKYFFYQQNGQFFHFMNNKWIPCNIQGIRNISGHDISIDVGQPLLIIFPNQTLYTEPVGSIEVTI